MPKAVALRALAAEDGPVEQPETIDVTQLSGTEGILVVHPIAALPASELAKLMRRGGRVETWPICTGRGADTRKTLIGGAKLG